MHTLPSFIEERDKAPFNQLVGILSDESSISIFEGKGIVVARKSHSSPLWAYAKENADEKEKRLAASAVLRLEGGTEVKGDLSFLHGVDLKAGTPFLCLECMDEGKCSCSVHRMVKSDVPLYAKLLGELYADTPGPRVGRDMIGAMAGSERKIKSTYLLKENGKAISALSVSFRGFNLARISGVVTLREMRGKGYAAKLLRSVVRTLKAEGLRPLLYVDEDNNSAIACYRSAGFMEIGKLGRAYLSK